MDNTYTLISHIDKTNLSLVTVDYNGLRHKINLKSKNNIFSFSLNSEINYFFFMIDNIESDYLYPNSLINSYELYFLEQINSYAINLLPEYKEGIYHEYSLNNIKILENETINQKFWTYIPKNSKNNELGLIISFDGQNAFYRGKYKSQDQYGGTQLDIIADALSEKYNRDYMILAIDNGNKTRSRALTMSQNFGKVQFNKIKNFDNKLDKGYLEYYLDFIIAKMIPFIQNEYNIDPKNIGILGQSSGGLASFYSAVKCHNQFSFGLSLSPAFPFFKKEDLLSFYKNNIQPNSKYPKIYLYSGCISELEENICNSLISLYEDLHIYNKDNLSIRINKEAKHNEIAWRIALNEGLKKVLLED